MTALIDPLADIRDHKNESTRGDWRDLIFERPGVVSQQECVAVKHLFARYEGAQQTQATQDGYRVRNMWLGGVVRATDDTRPPSFRKERTASERELLPPFTPKT